ncbi:MAG: tetratricopeptide repeat protein [Acidobacteria bacterium]|nr:tetratricopeptide repeat protein [Acidobacteriota bacterium]MBV9475591.1 tetratricopeptide repeat protein [Acidobacteriota bacterium]
MNPPTDWASAIAILAAGLLLGALFVYFYKRRTPAAPLAAEPDLARRDLEAKRDALVAELRAPDVDAAERARLERETADVLRQLDAMPARATSSASTTAAARPAMSPQVQGFLWGAGSMALLAALGFYVMNHASDRKTGEGATGGGPMQSAQQQTSTIAPAQQAPDPAVLQLEAAVQKDPNNLQLRNELAQAYLERENLMGVFEQTRVVLAKSPNDSRALTFQALVRMSMGDQASAKQMLQQATKSDPKNLDSWVALAWIDAQNGKIDEAQSYIAEATRQVPAEKARLDAVFAQMKQHVTDPQQLAQGGGGGEQQLPPGHPSIDGAGAAASPAASAQNSGPSVRVTVDLDPSAKGKSGILFVFARNPAGGPPAAVKRLADVTFPVTVELSSADSMLGQPLPASFRLEARLDSDGNAMTRTPGDPSAAQENVTPGAAVRLSLK